jgi:hypothetical protein
MGVTDVAGEMEREEKLAQLKQWRELGESAFHEMYEVHSWRDASACFLEAKENFSDAIRLAEELGLTADAEDLRRQMENLEEVYSTEFAG